MDSSAVFIHLGLIETIGPSSVQKIINAVGVESIEKLYQYSQHDFMLLGFDESRSLFLVNGLADRTMLDRELELIEKECVTIVTRYNFEYSPLLAQIHVPPVVLYCQGDVGLLRAPKTIACVGARKSHRYALDALQKIVVPLIHDGWVVVSGGAAGADTYAHQTALNQNGKTIVVVGTGLSTVYPMQNKKLFESVVDSGGLIVSIFPMGMHSDPRCFPARNRIISGLSLGCVVFQAASKSGALITATQALDQGREVFAIPGSIFDPLSAGCHDLIGQGAKLVTCAQDILSEFSHQHDVEMVAQQINIFTDPGVSVEKIAKPSKQAFKKSISTTALELYEHGSLERQIIDAVAIPMTADGLMQKFQINLVQLQSILFALSLDGLVQQDGMGFWIRV